MLQPHELKLDEMGDLGEIIPGPEPTLIAQRNPIPQFGAPMRRPIIPVCEPWLSGNELKYITEAVETNWISSAGGFIHRFEAMFAEKMDTRYGVACMNGTVALHLALATLGLEPGDEVIIPTFTMIATANAVTYLGAKPVLVDSELGTWNMDIEQIEAKVTARTKAIIPVHTYGHPVDMDALNVIAQKHGLFVLEDAAEAHGAKYKARAVGSLGDAASFSFYGNKIITTGEGGMVTTNDDELAAKLRLYRGQGMDPKRRYWFPVVGYNYRMTNIQAAIGLAQMEGIEKALADRETLAGWYNDALANLQDKIVLPSRANWAKQVFWMYNIFLHDGDEHKRDDVMSRLDAMGIETRPVFYPMHVLPPYQEESSYPVADLWAQRGINLPTHQDLTRDDVERVTEGLRLALSRQ